MKKLTKVITILLTITTLFYGFILSHQLGHTAFAANHREIINLGILVKFADSDNIAAQRSDGTPYHIDDADSRANAELLLNSDQLITMQTSAGQISVPSIKKYYETQSYGQLSITTKFFTYQDQHPMGYYLPKSTNNTIGYEAGQKSERESELVNNTLNAIQNEVTASGLTADMLDGDNDGKLDMITLFVEPAANTPIDRDSIFWSHVSGNSDSITAQISGKGISTHTIIYSADTIEEYGTFSLKTSSYGTLAHEIGHVLGFRDLYRKDERNQPVGIFDLMGKVTSSNPQNLSAYLVSEYQSSTNWHNPLPTITQTTKNITVSKPQFTDPNEQRAIKVQPNSTSKEYFIIEYYAPHDARTGFAAKDQGIIIYRVNDNYKVNGNYYSDSTDAGDHIFVFRPNEPTLGAGLGDILQAPLNSSRPTLGKALGSTTDFDNQTIYYADGSNSGIIITVTKMDNSSVTFDVIFPKITGDGSAQNPYQISDNTTFLYLMNNDTKGKYYTLTENLDFTNITYPDINFYGHLDGQNHTFSNITAAGVGIFNNLGDYNSASSIRNLKVNNLTINPSTNGSSLGGLASVTTNVIIENVHLLSGEISNTKGINDLSATGGFVGNANSTTIINNCSTALSVSSNSSIGGFIGLNQNAKISNSHATGKINGTANIGGFIGIQYITDTTYNTPQNVTYNGTINPDILAVGTTYDPTSFKFITTPSNLLQGITANTTPDPIPTPDPDPEPTPQPNPAPTEAEVLAKLKLTKKQNYLFGFELNTGISAIRTSFANIKGVSIVSLQNNNNQVIATGIKLSLHISTTTYNYIIVVKGDVNGDGKIQATDYVKIRNHIMGKTQLSNASLQAADINQDSKIQATDYVKVRNHIMGKSIINQK